MNIGITLKRNSYTPEAYAYKKFLENLGYKVQLDYLLDPNNDINIYFMGIKPFWKIEKGNAIEIHEYQSLSTYPFAKIKNLIKQRYNKKPAGRIFLNSDVRSELNFHDSIPYIYRDMGVDKRFYQKPYDNPEFDIVYAGSIIGRIGLLNTIIQLSKKYKILFIGDVDSEINQIFLKHGVITTGKISYQEIPSLYKNARFGLNYTPDIYPFNIQTSTKTLEYLASGLHVISNNYYWINNFFKQVNYTPVWLDFALSKANYDLLPPTSNFPDMNIFSWDHILTECSLEKFIINL